MHKGVREERLGLRELRRMKRADGMVAVVLSRGKGDLDRR